MKSIYNDIAREYYLKRDFAAAIAYVTVHLRDHSHDAEAWLNLGKALTNTEKFLDAENALLLACKLAPEKIDYLLDLQVLYSLTCEVVKYNRIVEKLKAAIPDEPRLIFNCAWDRMRAGETYEGFADLEVGRKMGFFGSNYYMLTPGELPWGERLTNIKDIAGHKIALIGEGGLGDEIISARYAPLIERYGGIPELMMKKSLHSILSHLGTCKEKVEDYDYYLPGLGAVALFREIPNEKYLFPKAEYVAKHGISSDKIKVGICWHGNTSYEWEQIRGVPKESLYGLVSDTIDVFSLQQDDTNLDLSTWDDTLGVIANLDCVVSSCTSVVHAAGAMGKRVLVLSPLAPYYPWITKEKWYPDVTIMRKNPEHGYDIEAIKRWICQ